MFPTLILLSELTRDPFQPHCVMPDEVTNVLGVGKLFFVHNMVDLLWRFLHPG